MIDQKKIAEELKLEVGFEFNTFYGNGAKSGSVTITRLTDSSVFTKRELSDREFRDSFNSVKTYIAKKLWIKK